MPFTSWAAMFLEERDLAFGRGRRGTDGIEREPELRGGVPPLPCGGGGDGIGEVVEHEGDRDVLRRLRRDTCRHPPTRVVATTTLASTAVPRRLASLVFISGSS